MARKINLDFRCRILWRNWWIFQHKPYSKFVVFESPLIGNIRKDS